MANFQADYAQAYDRLYADKDYERECAVVLALCDRFGQPQPARILDLGCGTGNHALGFARRGIAVTGVDRSAAMLAQARRKSAGALLPPRYVRADIRRIALGRRFDVATMLFAVLSYQLDNEDAAAALAAARRHLRPGGLLVFDVWFGPGVVRSPPGRRTKSVGGVRREARGTLDLRRQWCTVDYRVTVAADKREFRERHTVRFFFPRELELLFDRAGFALEALQDFGRWRRPAGIESWNAWGVARAIPSPGAARPSRGAATR